jgi:hypothetical protein
MSPAPNRPRTARLRGKRVATLLLAAIALAGASCDNKYCGGPVITCAHNESDCATIAGCRAAAACQYEGGVDRACSALATQSTCEAATTSDCTWSGDGCASTCGTITDPTTCASFDPGKGFPCTWSTCSGVPAKPSCEDYPADQCPSRLGCQVMQNEPVGT